MFIPRKNAKTKMVWRRVLSANLARILTSMRGYIYAVEPGHLYILSHIGSFIHKRSLYVKLTHKGHDYTLTIDGMRWKFS